MTLAGSLKHTIGSEVRARSHAVHGKTSNHLCVRVCVGNEGQAEDNGKHGCTAVKKIGQSSVGGVCEGPLCSPELQRCVRARGNVKVS